MIKLCGVRRADLAGRDGGAQEGREHLVGPRVVLALVEGQDDEGAVLVEVLVREQGVEEVARPLARHCDGCVVSVVGWRESTRLAH